MVPTTSVGSFGKPDYLVEGRARHARNELTQAELERLEERATEFWVREQDKGRVFVCILGHYTWTFDDPLFRILVLRGMCWSAREPVDRLSEFALPGARIEE